MMTAVFMNGNNVHILSDLGAQVMREESQSFTESCVQFRWWITLYTLLITTALLSGLYLHVLQ